MPRHCLPALLLAIICCFGGHFSMAQQPSIPSPEPLPPAITTAPRPTGAETPIQSTPPPTTAHSSAGPLYILNSSIIIGNYALYSINPNDIETIDVYKDADTPPQWRPFSADGIIHLTFKKNVKLAIKSRTLPQIGKHLALSGIVSYTVNGKSMTDSSLRIANDAIAGIKITRAASSSNVLVDISIASEVRDTSPAPPGTIRIRGTASR